VAENASAASVGEELRRFGSADPALAGGHELRFLRGKNVALSETWSYLQTPDVAKQ